MRKTVYEGSDGRATTLEPWPRLPDNEAERRRILDGWVTAEPENRDAAMAERARLVDEKMSIQAQLSDPSFAPHRHTDDYHLWRQRAISANYMRDRRISFLREWLRTRPSAKQGHPTDLPAGILRDYKSLTVRLRSLIKLVGELEAIYVAALQWVDDENEETADVLRGKILKARELMERAVD